MSRSVWTYEVHQNKLIGDRPMPRRKLDATKADWPNKVDAVTNDPARIERRKDMASGVTVPGTRAGAA